MEARGPIRAITIGHGPAIPGLTFRHFRGEPDYPGLARVLNSGCVEDGLEMAFTSERIHRKMKYVKHANPFEDWIIAEVDGKTVAYCEADWWQETAGSWIFPVNGCVDPAWRRKGIGQAILRWVEGRMRRASDRTAGPEPRHLQTWIVETRDSRKALFTGEGYGPYTYEVMMVRPDLEEIPEAPLPPGLEQRPVRQEHYRRIFEAETEAFRDHWGHREPREEDFAAFTSGPIFDPTLWIVAWDGDEVIGMVRAFIDHEENETFGRLRGYSENISVRKPWRRRGVARALLSTSLRVLEERGMEESALWVHLENPDKALNLYESAGFRVREKYAIYKKPIPPPAL